MSKMYRGLLFLGWLLYGLAALVLIAGIVVAVSFYGGASGVAGLLPMLQALGGPGMGDIAGSLLRPLLAGVGNGLLIVSLLLSLLLFACGQLVMTVRGLSIRVQQLEMRAAPG